MDLFRLTYFQTQPSETDKWKSSDRYELYGSAEAICNLYIQLKKLQEANVGSCPNFIDIFNKDGFKLNDAFKEHGLQGLYGNSNNTFK